MYRHVFICVKWFGQWSDRGKTSESFKITWASCWCCWCHSWWHFPLKDEMLSQFDFHMGLAHRIWCWRPICWSATSCWMRGSKWVSSERSRRWTQISTVKCWSKNSRSFFFCSSGWFEGVSIFLLMATYDVFGWKLTIINTGWGWH